MGDHGVHVLDCDAIECGAGSGGSGNGSPVSVEVTLKGVMIDKVGTGYFNGDEGIKLTAEDAGDLMVRLHRVVVTDNRDDGIQIGEENGNGIVDVQVTGRIISDNSRRT